MSSEHYSNITGPYITNLLGNLAPVYVWILKLCGGMARGRNNRRSRNGMRMETNNGQNIQQRTSTRRNTQNDQQEVRHNDIIMQNLTVCKLSKEHYSNITGPYITNLLGNLAPVYVWIFKMCGGKAQCRRNKRSNNCMKIKLLERQIVESRTSSSKKTETRTRGHFPTMGSGHPTKTN